ncbi:hypothetical protein [Sulfurospirillum sp. UCH001]|uniref:hypothetical protein n=1 Tax=Sulfurospirillum sp. UCH001 TaxID=1581011 RepID=UPI0008341021|nr:hypothetical protein [Sulfurospirillum sp. UCH001]
MSGIAFSKINLANLIDHHIALLERFGIKDEVPFSLIFFSLEDREEMDSLEMFQRILRRTDAIFNHSNHYVVMLTGTDWNGATEVLSGIQNFLDQEPFDNVVTYPDDGTDSKTLLHKLRELVEENYNITTDLLK